LSQYLRVAFLPDTFHEVNGVAHTSRQFEAFARRRQIPFLSVHGGDQTGIAKDGVVTIMQLKRGPLAFPLDANLDCDPFLMRHYHRVKEQASAFGAEVIHVTGPGDMGLLGWRLAKDLRLPLAMSWHTMLHEYAGRRMERLLSLPVLNMIPRGFRQASAHWAEKLSLRFLGFFYRQGRVLLAPNQELVELLRQLTGRQAFLMQRGVDTTLFTPARRNRTSNLFRLGYVGRLTPEKNVRFLAELGRALVEARKRDFEFMIIGEGCDKEWLRANVPNAHLPGVLRGEALAQAYADMDLFVFPSTTDTYGNVVVEALASGVPAVVTNQGGPKFLVQSGITGYVADGFPGFIRSVNALRTDLDAHHAMRDAARHYACGLSWDSVFEKVFCAYRQCDKPNGVPEPKAPDNPARLTA
jgi:phosphatidylinositol alpha 1,6-mannosyltransferase